MIAAVVGEPAEASPTTIAASLDEEVAPAPFKPVSLTNNCSQYRDLVAKYFPANQVNNALNVMMGESSCRPRAVGDKALICNTKALQASCTKDNSLYGASYGLFQIRWLPSRPTTPQLKDADFNVKYASEMYKAQGWRPWSAAKKIGLK